MEVTPRKLKDQAVQYAYEKISPRYFQEFSCTC